MNYYGISKWNRHTHVKGKAYDLTQENMNRLIEDVEYLQNEIKGLQMALDAITEMGNRARLALIDKRYIDRP